MNGYEATRQIKAKQREMEGWEAEGTAGDIPDSQFPIPKQQINTIIIAVTASAFEEERAEILAAGCDDFVRKPFREEVIWEKMAQHLGVRYVYVQKDEEGKSQQEKTTPDLRLDTSELSVMPTEWLVQLHQSATELRAKEIIQLTKQIPEETCSTSQNTEGFGR